MEKGEMSKRGDVTISTVILIVLGLAVLVFLVIGLTQGWDIFFGNVQTVDPGDLQVLAKACEGYLEAGLSISFCEYKSVEIGGDDEYVNCRDERILSLVRQESSKTPPTCTQTEEDFCRSGKITDSKYNSVKVNGNTCAGRNVAVCRGTATACNAITDQAKCGASVDDRQLGCSWIKDVCTGSVTVCSGLDQAKCGTGVDNEQLGCEWKIPS